MSINPFIPIPVMVIFCAALIVMKRKGVWNFIRQIIVAVLIFLVNLRILIPTDHVENYSNNIKVLFVVDNTISMLAEDYNGSDRRIDGVRHHIQEIMDNFEGARFALISFNDISGNVMVPYTTDKKNVIQAANSLEGRSKIYASGSSFNTVYSTLKDYLEGTFRIKDEEEQDSYIQLIFFISDGEMNTKDSIKSFDSLSSHIDGGAVLGYGTTKGGIMRVKEYSSSDTAEVLTYYDKGKLVTALSKIDEKNLEKLADELGVTYTHVMRDEDVWKVVDSIKDKIDSGEMTSSSTTGIGYLETYYIFAAALFVFLIYDLIYYGRKIGRGQ